MAQTVMATFVAFFFFAIFFRAQPFKQPMLNAVKAFSEFVIFGVLVTGTVEQAEQAIFAEEDVSIDNYGHAQTILCLMFAPVTVFYSECTATHFPSLSH